MPGEIALLLIFRVSRRSCARKAFWLFIWCSMWSSNSDDVATTFARVTFRVHSPAHYWLAPRAYYYSARCFNCVSDDWASNPDSARQLKATLVSQ